jgi:hypothetical protein
VDDATLKIITRAALPVSAAVMLALVSLFRKSSGAAPTAFSGRRGPLLGIGVVGALTAIAAQWVGRDSQYEDPSESRVVLLLIGFAIAVGGFLPYGYLVRRGGD